MTLNSNVDSSNAQCPFTITIKDPCSTAIISISPATIPDMNIFMPIPSAGTTTLTIAI